MWDFVLHIKIESIVNREIRKLKNFLPDIQSIDDFRSEIRLRIIDFVIHKSPVFTSEACLVSYFSKKIKSDAITSLRKIAPIGTMLTSGKIIKKNKISLDRLYTNTKYDLGVLSIYTDNYKAFIISLSNGILESSWTGGSNIIKNKMFLRKLARDKNIVVFNDREKASDFSKHVTSSMATLTLDLSVYNISNEEKALLLAKTGHRKIETTIMCV